MEAYIYSFYFIFLLLMLFQGMVTLYLMLYAWEDPDRLKAVASPKKFAQPQMRFTILLPARNEQKVIGKTIQSIAFANYPRHLIDIITICEEKDVKTIQAAQTVIKKTMITNAHVVTFNDTPVNKPHGLNKGLWAANSGPNEIITIFDAEDEVNPDIFNVINTLYLRDKPDIIQAGVQLMNYYSRWFSLHNVLEYYFWFKSRMHFHIKVGVVPLGGNTVFFKTDQLRAVGGWDESCLTEDAEIGIRLSAMGAKVISTYDPAHITKEETPLSINQFIKQRTRWNQGFIQILDLGHWKEYDSFAKRAFCFYTLSFPVIQTILFFLTPATLFIGLFGKFPLFFALLSFIPLLIVLIQLTVNAIGIREFIIEQHLPYKKSVYFSLVVTFIPYQFLLGISALRALYREVFGITNWEKTIHHGTHRNNEITFEIMPDITKQLIRRMPQYEIHS
jgi:cellulose synthase/poly-beta-1,6-N-acetylglucosamine synthase-like glycosyltransferase